MTAVNAAARGDVGYVLTDTLLTEAGKPTGHAVKAIPVAHGRFVLAYRGLHFIGFGIISSAQFFTSFDQMRATVPGFLRDQWPSLCRNVSAKETEPFEVLVMGWSDIVSAIRLFTMSAPDFSAQDVECTVAPKVGADIRDIILSRHDDNDVPGTLSAFLTEQMKIEPETIGGMAVLTTIMRDKIEQRVVRMPSLSAP